MSRFDVRSGQRRTSCAVDELLPDGLELGLGDDPELGGRDMTTPRGIEELLRDRELLLEDLDVDFDGAGVPG